MFLHFYKKQQRRHRNRLFVFSMLSAFISAVAAIMLTPKSGKDMRQSAVEKAKEVSDNIKKVSTKAGEKVAEKASDLGEKIESTRNIAVNQASSITDKALDAGEKLIQKLRSRKEQVEDEAVEK